ncbi:hypothetical protein VKT23_007339 [Stygiomarasmius scandens]|uniref:Uncharacterized protein n=1 Tax=Marasmiellus scandens TaxID=2682957 RepID=A0ABR1JM43_9AGAR
MPLFKSQKHSKHAEAEPIHHGRPTTNLNDDYDYDYSRGTGAGASAAAPMHHSGVTDTYPGPGTGVGREPHTRSSPVGSDARQGPAYSSSLGYGSGDPYSSAGVGHDKFGGGPAGIPPTHALNAGQATAGEHTGGSMTGKVEKTIGTMVGSRSLKEKGMMKEQEAQSLKMQSAELAEAERLEREALMRRERAVAHGAHPDMKHLGGVEPTGFQ